MGFDGNWQQIYTFHVLYSWANKLTLNCANSDSRVTSYESKVWAIKGAIFACSMETRPYLVDTPHEKEETFFFGNCVISTRHYFFFSQNPGELLEPGRPRLLHHLPLRLRRLRRHAGRGWGWSPGACPEPARGQLALRPCLQDGHAPAETGAGGQGGALGGEAQTTRGFRGVYGEVVDCPNGKALRSRGEQGKEWHSGPPMFFHCMGKRKKKIDFNLSGKEWHSGKILKMEWFISVNHSFPWDEKREKKNGQD